MKIINLTAVSATFELENESIYYNKDKFDVRHAYFTNFKDDNTDLIDQCVATFFAGPNSFTGTDIIVDGGMHL